MVGIAGDTIVALATPPGRAGIAIIRLSGPLVPTIIHTWCRSALKPRLATHLPFYDEEGIIIDEGLAIYFKAPHSFTGEEILELHTHGSPIVTDALIQRMLSLGCRLAKPGEYSERAFLNGKIDLAQAEAIADLINASSLQAARSAMRSLQGQFSEEVNVLHQKIVHLRMFIEAQIDFSEEEIDFLTHDHLYEKVEDILNQLNLLHTKAKQGALLRDGIHVVITGAPNVGKSSILNALSEKETAIVTDIAGTTRDVLRELIVLDGLPLHLIDTAGLRDSHDVVEQEGIRRAHAEIKNADLILKVVNGTDDCIIPVMTTCPIILVRNKIDLLNEPPSLQNGIVSISAKERQGLDLLKQVIQTSVGFTVQAEGTYIARRRHLDALAKAKKHLEDCALGLRQSKYNELIAEDLRLSHLSLAEMTGEFTTEDLLTHIFSTFCIGK